MRFARSRTTVLVSVLGLAVAGLAAFVAPTAVAADDSAAATTGHPLAIKGLTTVTTAPGIAGVLVDAGVIPLPVAPSTVESSDGSMGLVLSYGFKITGGNPDFDDPAGKVRHSGGLNFVASDGTALEVGKFEIDLKAGKIFAQEINGDKGTIALLDLDLSKARITMPHERVIVSNIGLYLDPAAAEALNATFGLGLPTDGSLLFGKGRVAATR